MKSFRFLSILFVMALIYSCDDATTGIGDTTIPQGDHIGSNVATYQVSTKSISVDSVYARTSTAYLGRYTDPIFGEFTADFMAQFTCTDNYEFPDNIKEVNGLNLYMQYSGFYGDSLAIMKMQIDSLCKVIPEESIANFYTSIKPSEFYNSDAAPLVSRAYSAGGSSVDTIYTSGSSKVYNQTIALPNTLADHLVNKYKENKNNYKNAATFINNVLKGLYIHCTSGDGSVLYINNLVLQLEFKYYVESSSGKIDSLVNGCARFAATKEVIQANHFKNAASLKQFISDKNLEGENTYIKTPAGILTEVTLPIDEIEEAHKNDTINSASITFTKYNNDDVNIKYPMGVPQYLLMIPKKDLYSFFENNMLPDNKTSFIATLGSTTATQNQYVFSNISRLIINCIANKNNGLKTDANWLNNNSEWNKVVIVPVTVEYDNSATNPSVIKVSNSLDIQSVRLIGGKDKLNLKIIYTNF